MNVVNTGLLTQGISPYLGFDNLLLAQAGPAAAALCVPARVHNFEEQGVAQVSFARRVDPPLVIRSNTVANRGNTAPSRHSEPARWVALSGLSDAGQKQLLDLTAEVADQLAACEQRAKILETKYTGHFTNPSQREEWQRLSYRLDYNRGEICRQGQFPSQDELKIELKRLRILYHQLRDLALTVIEAPDLEEPDSPRGIPTPLPVSRLPNTPTSKRFTVNRIIPDLINKPDRRALGIDLRPYQRDALSAIIREDELAARDPEFARDDMVLAMPTGSGKTNVMIATCAWAIQENRVNFKRGDKIILTTHLQTITTQNRQALVDTLGQQFKARYGHDLKVTQYGMGESDLSGDIVIVSIPATVEKSASDDRSFFSLLEKALPQSAGVPLLIMDEVHHENAPTWQLIKTRITELSTRRGMACRRVGFTATPLPEQRERQIYYLGNHDALKRGISPDTHIVTLRTGLFLQNLRTTKTGDFDRNELAQSVNTPERNRFIMTSLAGIPPDYRNNTGDAFLPMLGFAVDTQHARDLAREFVTAFGFSADDEVKIERHQSRFGLTREEAVARLRAEAKKEDPIYFRKTGVIHANATLKEIAELVRKKAAGEIQALIAVVDGSTQNKKFTEIMKLAQAGELEAVFTCRKLEEGFDAHWARILVGGRPTLSPQQKAQELGRILRRSRQEYNRATGELFAVPPRLVMEFLDGGYGFAEYREVVGMRHMLLEDGVIYNMTTQAPHGDSEQRQHNQKRKKRQQGKKTKTMGTAHLKPGVPNKVWRLGDALMGILRDHYAGDSTRMAADLGWDAEGWEERLTNAETVFDYTEVHEIAALLYQDRHTLTGSALAGEDENKQGILVARLHDVIGESITLYLGHKGLALTPRELTFKAGAQKLTFNLKADNIRSLPRKETPAGALLTMGMALYYLLRDEGFNRQRQWVQESLDGFLAADPEEGSVNAVLGQIVWDRTLQGILETAPRPTSEAKKDFLGNWFRAVNPDEESIPDTLYITAGARGIANGKIIGGVSLKTVVEFERWPGKNSNSHPKICCHRTHRGWEVTSENDTRGHMAKTILDAFVMAGIVDAARVHLATLTRDTPVQILEQDKVLRTKIKKLFDEAVADWFEDTLYITAGSGGVQKGKIIGGLQLKTVAEFEQWPGKNLGSHPKICCHRTHRGWEVTAADDMRGLDGEIIFGILVAANVVTSARAQLAILTRDTPVQILEQDEVLRTKIKKLFDEAVRDWPEDTLYITAGAGGINADKIANGISLKTTAEFEQWPGKGSIYCPKIRCHKTRRGWEVLSLDDVERQHAEGILEVLATAGAVNASRVRLGLLTRDTPLKIIHQDPGIQAKIKDLFDEIVTDWPEDTLYITAGAGGIKKSGRKISKGINIVGVAEFEQWAGKRSVYYPKICCHKTSRGWAVATADDIKGQEAETIFNALATTGALKTVRAHFTILTRDTPFQVMLQDPAIQAEIKKLFDEAVTDWPEDMLYITAGASGGAKQDCFNKGLTLRTEAEFLVWDKKDNKDYPKVLLRRECPDAGWSTVHASGPNAKVIRSLVESLL